MFQNMQALVDDFFPWQGSVEEVGGLLQLFLQLYPLLVDRIHVRSWLRERTCCRISTVPVAMSGAGSSGRTLLARFD